MESVLIPGKVEADKLLEMFYKATGRVDYKNMHSGSGSEVVIITCDRFFLRTRGYVGFVLFSYYDGTSTKIDYGIAGAGSSGMLGRGGAGNAIFDDITRGLSDLVASRKGGPQDEQGSMP